MPSPIGFHACPMEKLLPDPTQSHPLTQAVPINVLRQSVLDDKNSFYYKFYIATYFLSENYTLFPSTCIHHLHELSSQNHIHVGVF